ncbi:MAG: pyrimidine 5'-nucleotidase [Mariprofundaceae bacterium]
MLFDLLIVDLDNTLYAADNGVFARMDQRMNAFVCRELGIAHDQADHLRVHYWRKYGSTLRGLVLHHGIEPEPFLQEVHDIQAHEILQENSALNQALSLLKMAKVIHTNGSIEHAQRILDALGVAQHFNQIYDIRFHDYRPKPCKTTLQMLLAEQGVQASRCLVIDDMQENLAVAKRLGTATCWVSDAERDDSWDYQVSCFELLPSQLFRAL